MALPKPVAGLIIRYSYLWYREHLEGRDEGQKDRPCAIVAALRLDENGDTRVLVLPITHTPPDHPALAVEIPFKVKNRLQLDDARSWVVLSEWNEFVWPGPDLRRLRGATEGSAAGPVRGDPRPVSGDRQFGQRATRAAQLSAHPTAFVA